MVETKPAVTVPSHQSNPINGEATGQISSDIAISVRNVSKMYPLYAQPSDRLKQSLWYALPKFLRGTKPAWSAYWAISSL
jgi:hypothetical protein